ncbi:MAG: isoaspartyl peptidase/L-asparaginase family protein [Methylococcaceae bacterium]|nr:isoaspartyl peptidase/L-asparaginase family protein [Methylococcaceae bacterium]
MISTRSYSLMVHGGAGAFENLRAPECEAETIESIRRILEDGREILQRGGSALQAVEACASLLEDDPLFNAGRGSVLNEQGRAEMDAAIMDGRDLSAGSVAAIGEIANPVQLARRVMSESGHVMLIGEGAVRFAAQCGIPRVPDAYFLIPERIEQLKEAQKKLQTLSDKKNDGHEFGTIGCVARDIEGNLAAATSTGGIVNKLSGRVGDSPLIGAGLHADNETCAASATGHGEDFMRTVLCKMISDYVYLKGMDAHQATAAGIDFLTRRICGQGGVIVIDHAGNCASGFTTRKMIQGWIERGAGTIVRI